MAISVTNLSKTYRGKDTPAVEALKGVTFALPSAGLVFILGKSGCGKTTLMNMIGGLDSFDGGDLTIDGRSVKSFSDGELIRYRNRQVGFVYQENNLLDEYTVERNVGMALALQGKKDYKEEVARALSAVELDGCAKAKPNRLSGGQKQRVAIARAIVKRPKILLCDEPTGSLDEETGETIFALLKQISKSTLVVVVSHDREAAEAFGDRVIELRSGRVVSDRVLSAIQEGQADACPEAREAKGRIGFPVRDVFKMGAGLLFARPVRMVVAFVMCLMTFTLFGMADAVTAYDRDVAVFNTMQSCGAYHIWYGGVDSQSLSKLDVQILQDAAGEDIRLDMIHDDLRGEFNELDMDMAYPDYYNAIYQNQGYAEIDESLLKDYDFKLVAGRLPQADDEAVITLLTFHNLQRFGTFAEEIDEYSDILFKTVSIGEGEQLRSFKVVGVLDTKFNTSLYGTSYGEYMDPNSLTQEMYGALQEMLYQGMHNILYLQKGYYAAHNAPQTFWEQENIAHMAFSDFDIYAGLLHLADESFLQSVGEGDWFYRVEDIDIMRDTGVIIRTGSVEELYRKYLNSLVESFASDNWQEVAERFTADMGEDSTCVDYELYILNHTDEDGNVYQPGYDRAYFEKEAIDHFLAALQGELPLASEKHGWNFSVPVAGVIEDETLPLIKTEFHLSEDLFNKICDDALDFGQYEFAVCSGFVTPYKGSDEYKMRLIRFTQDILKDGKAAYAPDGDAFSIVGDIDHTACTVRNIFLYVTAGAVVLSVLLLMYYTSGVVQEKRREIGIMHALGAKRSDILKIFAVDNGLFAVVAIVLASILAAVGTAILNGILVGDYVAAAIITFGIRQIALVAVLALVATALGVAAPVIRLLRAKPVDVIAGRK